MRISLRCPLFLLPFLVLSIFACSASSALAASPWWHLSSGTTPAAVQPGAARDEVQEITAAPESAFELSVAGGNSLGFFESAPYPYGAVEHATHENVQAALESAYGAGNVVVTGGPAGVAPLIVTSVNGDADRSVVGVDVHSIIGSVSAQVTTTGRADGEIVLSAANLGDADANGAGTPVTVADTLPAGLRAIGIESVSETRALGSVLTPAECSLGSLSCVYKVPIVPYEEVKIAIPVVVEDEAAAKSGVNRATVSGGEASGASVARPVAIGGGPVPFGVEDYELSPEEAGGALDAQAGSHPFQLTTTLTLNQTFEPHRPPAMAKDLRFKLPPGLVGNPTPFPQCTDGQFLTIYDVVDECPNDTALGVAAVNIEVPGVFSPPVTDIVPLFNLTPKVGEPARFGFEALGVPVYLDTSVRTGGDYGVTVTVENITQEATFIGNRVTFWGVPGDSRHDDARGWSCIGDEFYAKAEERIPGSFPAPVLPCAPLGQLHPPPLLVLPTSCPVNPTTHLPEPLQTSVEADSWKEEGSFVSTPSTEPMPALDGCNRLQFAPSISLAPDGQAESTPTGLAVKVSVPQSVSLAPEGLAEADVKDTTVTLPEGVAINPAGADGLQACSEEEIALKSAEPPSCPEASKIGLVRIKTPLLPNELEGSAYLAQQDTNPFGSLVALYVFVEDPISGSRVKLAGEVAPNPVTGQLVSTFKNTPQLPFETFELHFFGGDRAPLSTPSLCGAYTTTASIEPWTETGAVASHSTFDVTSAPNGGPCRNPLAFDPSLTAGTTSIQAGGFSPFTMTMSREDGNQNLSSIELHMPPGLSGTLSNIKLCSEAQANEGICPEDSLIGETIVSVGLGGDPFSVKGGKVYLTGPYHGAPFGLSIVNPAKAGPFDLEHTISQHPACDCIVVRAKIEVDPVSAALTITSNPPGTQYSIPTIIEGIPLEIKHVNVTINHLEDFTFNPTNCNKLQITGTLLSTEGAADELSVPFQATNCAALGFKPGFAVTTQGKTSRADGASLTAKLSYPNVGGHSVLASGFANIAKVKVELPKQLVSRLSTLQKACTQSVFNANPAACPAASKIGAGKAITPLVPVPLEGPAYFVSNGNAKFPELIVVLQGYGITIDLHGETFISKQGVTSSTFATVPDAPVGSFELTLPEGPDSALAANGNLCTTKNLTMPTLFVAQDGVEIHQNTKITPTGCAKTLTGKHHKTKHHNKHKHHNSHK
jgi:hypothetical protein